MDVRPFCYQIEAADRVVVVTFDVPLGRARFERTLLTVLDDPAYRSSYGWVADFRFIPEFPAFDVVAETIQALATIVPATGTRPPRWARVIAERRPSAFVVARRAEHEMVRQQPWRTRTFFELAPAVRWAGGGRVR
jgi:hypothetical protein